MNAVNTTAYLVDVADSKLYGRSLQPLQCKLPWKEAYMQNACVHVYNYCHIIIYTCVSSQSLLGHHNI
jgi:hypothetical protein